jgi:tRNA 5-methylaminomethyl-2-thiouridine biosynthesis bifunctional protein
VTRPEQSSQYFLRDSALPKRWQHRARFAILQTGFGAGLDFLATWAAWQNDPLRCERLHFVVLEASPPDATALQQTLAAVAFDPLLRELALHLCAQWPTLLSGTQRLEFAAGRVVLTLAFGELLSTLPTLAMRADAFYLDAPADSNSYSLVDPLISNSLAHAHTVQGPFLLRGLTRLAAQNATLVATSMHAGLRKRLREFGFEITPAHDHHDNGSSDGGRIVASFAPRFRVRRHEPPAPFSEICPHAARDAIVIGAGLAGCALVERLAARGWQVSLIERQAAAAQEASGNPAGVFHPIVTSDDSFAARLSRAGFLYALRRWSDLRDCGASFNWHSEGLFVAAQNEEEFAAMRATLERLALPDSYVKLVSPEQASLQIGVTPAFGGWLFARGGWLDPAALCKAQLDAAGARLKRLFGQVAHRLERRGERWHVIDARGASIADASVVVVASAVDAQRLLGLRHLPLTAIRGQITLLPLSPDAAHLAPEIPLIGDGYLVRLNSASLMTGASYDLDDTDPELRWNSQRENLDRLAHLVPSSRSHFDSATLAGRVGLRCVTSDRMPVIGPVADEAAALALASTLNGAHLADVPRIRGLYAATAYGSRGLTWAALGAELIASQLDGEPWPVDRKLADGVDPARFLLRVLRQTL